MRNLNGFKWLCALVLIGGVANADVIIDNDSIPGSDIQSISISPASGNVFISTTPGYTVTKKASTPGGVVVNLAASSLGVNTSQSVTLSWSTSNATNCSATGNWSGNKGTAGNQKISFTAAGKYTYKLTCNNATTQASNWDSVTVTVSNPTPTPTNCKAPSLNNTSAPQDWGSFWGVTFPEPSNGIKRLDVGRTGYNYISFNTGNANGNGIVYLIETTTSPDGRIGSISECPGDFNVASSCKASWGIDAWIPYSTSGRSGRCQLKKDTDYFLNFTFTDGKDASTSTCKSRNCVVEIQTGFKSE